MFDITIVGAGPAGATLARLLGKTYKVLLLDKRPLSGIQSEGVFEKCCGGLLAPDAQHMLAVFGLGVPQNILAGPQLFTVRTIDVHNHAEQYYQRHYINVDREKFDRWLVSLIPAEAELQFKSTYRGFVRQEDHIKVSYFQNNREYSADTRILVGADGAFSKVRRQAFPNDPFPKIYVAIQEWYRAENSLPYFSSIFDSDITDFYSWTIPKEDRLILGTAVLPEGDPCKKFRLLKERLVKRGFELGESLRRRGSYLLRPEKVSQIHTGSGSIALVGEAAGWISPSSAEGFSYAFRSALALAKALKEGPEGFERRYARHCAKLKFNIFSKNIKSPFIYHPILRKAAMKSGLMSMKILEEK